MYTYIHTPKRSCDHVTQLEDPQKVVRSDVCTEAKLKYPLGLAPSGTFNYLEQREEQPSISLFMGIFPKNGAFSGSE